MADHEFADVAAAATATLFEGLPTPTNLTKVTGGDDLGPMRLEQRVWVVATGVVTQVAFPSRDGQVRRVHTLALDAVYAIDPADGRRLAVEQIDARAEREGRPVELRLQLLDDGDGADG